MHNENMQKPLRSTQSHPRYHYCSLQACLGLNYRKMMENFFCCLAIVFRKTEEIMEILSLTLTEKNFHWKAKCFYALVL